MEPVIIDFGYSERVETSGQMLSYNVGSPAYMSPEAYNDNQYSEKSDVWALGVILHEMITGTIPIMRTTDVVQYFRSLRSMKTAEIINVQQSSLTTSLLLHALAVDTRLRFSTHELLNELKSFYNPVPSVQPKHKQSQVLHQTAQKIPLGRAKPMFTFTENGSFGTPQSKATTNENAEWSQTQRKIRPKRDWFGV
jgi:serine/threonine protein kinase